MTVTAEETAWTLIFAGTADIDAENLTALLDHWLPADLEVNPPVIHLRSASTHPGLEKVNTYLTDQFGGDAIEYVPSVAEHLTGLEPAPDQYLVVLWGEGGDEETEKLVDQASRLGVTVLDLTDGLEEFTLGAEPPEEPPPPPAPSRVSRRRANSTAAAAARMEGLDAEDREDAAADDPVGITGLERIAAALLHRALTAALKELEELDASPATEPPSDADAKKNAKEKPAAANGSAGGSYPRQGAPGVEYAADADVETPSGTKKYLIDPDTNEYKRLRGRPRTDRKDWKFIFLTPEREQELDLVSS